MAGLTSFLTPFVIPYSGNSHMYRHPLLLYLWRPVALWLLKEALIYIYIRGTGESVCVLISGVKLQLGKEIVSLLQGCPRVFERDSTVY